MNNLHLNLMEDGEFPPAVLSEDGKYRYFLSRYWGGEGKKIAFIGLNPSTADAYRDDPTIRRCISFAKAWGGSSLLMVNLFAFRATNPADLYDAHDPVGADNDDWLLRTVGDADLVVAAWGNHGDFLKRASVVSARFEGRLSALAITKQGMPMHPLYISSSTVPVDYSVVS